MSQSDILQLIFIGIAQGCGYALVAMGFVFIYRATEIINFAHGDLMMLGAFAVYTLVELLGFNFWLGALIGVLFLGVFGYLLDSIIMRRVVGEPQASIFILTVSFGFILKSMSGMIWGWTPMSLNSPFSGGFAIGDITFGTDRVVIILGTILICVLLYFFFNRTNVGIAIQASSQNQLAAYYMKIPVKKLISVIWAIAAVVAAIAGFMMAPVTQVDTGIAAFGIKAFAGAVVGGFGSIPGALLGCLLVGIAEPFCDYLYPPLKGVYAYMIMLLVLFVWPEGIIPQTFQKKV